VFCLEWLPDCVTHYDILQLLPTQELKVRTWLSVTLRIYDKAICWHCRIGFYCISLFMARNSLASAVQAWRDRPPVSPESSTDVPHRLQRSSVRRCRSPAPAMRSASRHKLTIPRVRCSTFGCRSFASAGPTVWNSLPDNLRNPAVGPDQFRRNLY